jgi:5-formyltetrahydrofolate cyclo-ligase
MNEEVISSKKSLRKEIKKLKSGLTPGERITKSSTVMKKLELHPFFAEAETVFIFWSMDDEVDTREFIVKWAGKKRFILPAINGDELYLKEFTGAQKLKAGDLYDIPEPDGTAFDDIKSIGLAIIPGVAFDANGGRLGRGKAYYDKILLKLKGRAKLIGICYDFQMVENVPVEPHDISVDEVIYA